MLTDVWTGRLDQGADLLPYRVRGGLKQFGNTVAHVSHCCHHGHPQFSTQGAGADMQSLRTDLVHHVQGDDQGSPQHAELERQFQVTIQCRGVHHLDNDIGRGIGCRWGVCLMGGHGWWPITPQQILHGGQFMLFDVVQGMDAGQVDDTGLIETDLHQGLAIGLVAAGELAGGDRRTRHRLEQGALATAGHAHQGDA